MKFGKEFKSQMVPEWQTAYMDYNYLKSVLKDLWRFKQRNFSPTMASSTSGSLRRRASLYRAFSGLNGQHRGSSAENEAILVTEKKDMEGERTFYQTIFFMSSEQGGEYELVFFRRLDEEFNKVNSFYKDKMEEVRKEAEELSKQMDILTALKVKVEKLVGVTNDDRSCSSSDTTKHHLNESIYSAVKFCTALHPLQGYSVDVIEDMEVINEVQLGDFEENADITTTTRQVAQESKRHVRRFKPASMQVLDRVKINAIGHETPDSTLKGVVRNLKPDISFSKEEIKKSEELMRGAFIEFYYKLRVLKSYSFLNMLAFSKIMKKYDKVGVQFLERMNENESHSNIAELEKQVQITSRNASKKYLETVDNSYVGSADEIVGLMERVEATFIKHFANGNRRKGMNTLRPRARRERHKVTFLSGFFSGCTIALVVATIVLVRARNFMKSEDRDQFMENIFPLYSLFGYIVLHMFMYSADVYFWRRYRVNYPFIFGFKQGTELGYREVFLLGSGLAVLTLSGVLINLNVEMDPETRSFKMVPELVPLGLVVVVLGITFFPFDIGYRSSRFFLLRSIFHCILAPFYKVTLPEFFLADQLTSQLEALRSLEFYFCYYGWGDFQRRSNACLDSNVYKTFCFVVPVIPFWIRSVQCLRRLVEEKDVMHGVNGFKYVSIIVAMVVRTSNEMHRGMGRRIMAGVTSGIVTIVSTYWDITRDWGLLQRGSRNPWLRDKLIVPCRSVYFVAMVLNIVLRLAWMKSVLGIKEAPFLHRTALTALMACLEIIRRGIWNFFRLENEHLNNVGKFRAFRSVPLPFNYDDEEEDKDI